MPLVDLNLPPGVVANGTLREAKGRWQDARFVRWVEGSARPIGKWTRVSPTPLPGRVCGMLPIKDDYNRQWLLVGTNEGIFVLRSGQWTDLTTEDFVSGVPVTTRGAGYGVGVYGSQAYGVPRTGTTNVAFLADAWTFDYWGQNAVGMSMGDGKARYWEPGTIETGPNTEMTVIPNAPEDSRALLVTNERHLMLLAAGGDPRKIQWSARENLEDWTPTALNLAGDLTLETAGYLMAGLKVANDIVILSEIDAFRVRYVGQPYGYGQERIGTNCGIAGPHAGVATSDFAVWMGANGFWTYRGQLQPLPCAVEDYVFRDFNVAQAAQVSCGHNADYQEVWWFFPKGDADRNSHYVAWNYRDNWWTVGELARTNWRGKGMWPAPLASGVDGHIYEHEKPLDAPAVRARPAPYIESGPFELGSGDRTLAVTHIMPDQECRSLDALRYSFKTRRTPTCPFVDAGPYRPNASGYTSTRFSGREFQMRVEAEQDIDWRLGILRADIKQGGRR